jgi:hypothetical protein
MDESPYRTSASPGGEPLFREVQRFRQAWLWALLGAVITMVAVAFAGAWGQIGRAHLHAAASGPALGIACFVGLLLGGTVALLYFARLDVAVHPGWLVVRFAPFHRRPRHFALASIASFEACTYSPIGDYGGWGLRGFGGDRCYTTSGHRGVRMRFHDGKTLMIGSQQAEELADALRRADRGGRAV